jgi:hypothetical protein
VVQVWQTPDWQLHSMLMSQASASSSTLFLPVSNSVEIPRRAKVTSGPVPGGPTGGSGVRGALPTNLTETLTEPVFDCR